MRAPRSLCSELLALEPEDLVVGAEVSVKQVEDASCGRTRFVVHGARLAISSGVLGQTLRDANCTLPARAVVSSSEQRSAGHRASQLGCACRTPAGRLTSVSPQAGRARPARAAAVGPLGRHRRPRGPRRLPQVCPGVFGRQPAHRAGAAGRGLRGVRKSTRRDDQALGLDVRDDLRVGAGAVRRRVPSPARHRAAYGGNGRSASGSSSGAAFVTEWLSRGPWSRSGPCARSPPSSGSARYVYRSAGDGWPGLGQPLVLGVGHDHRAVGEVHLVAGPVGHHVGRGDDRRRAAVGADHPVADRDLAHRRPAGRGGDRGVERQRLAHARSGRDDDHLAGLQAVGQLVEVADAGGHAAADAAAGGDGVQLVHRRLQDVLEARVVLAHALLGDVVDLLLRAVDDVVDVALAAGRAVAELDDAGAGLDEPAQHGLLGDDRRVVAGVGRGGRGRRSACAGRPRRPSSTAGRCG